MSIEQAKEKLKVIRERKKKTQYLEKLEENLEAINNKTKGLSYAIDNKTLKLLTKPDKAKLPDGRVVKLPGKNLNITKIGRLFHIYTMYKKNRLNGYLDFELLAFILNIPITKTADGEIKNYNMLKTRVRKALKELNDPHPIIAFKEDAEKGVKFTHIPNGANFGMYIEKGETEGFTQIYCNLPDVLYNLEIEKGNPLDFLVVHTVLEYFSGSEKEAYPSLDTIAKLCGCSRRKIATLLSEGEKIGLWKIKSTKGGSKKNTNRYILTDEQGKYLYLNVLEKLLKQEIERLNVEQAQ